MIDSIIRKVFHSGGTLSLENYNLGCVVPKCYRFNEGELSNEDKLSDYFYYVHNATHYELLPKDDRIIVNLYGSDAFGATEVTKDQKIDTFQVSMVGD